MLLDGHELKRSTREVLDVSACGIFGSMGGWLFDTKLLDGFQLNSVGGRGREWMNPLNFHADPGILS